MPCQCLRESALLCLFLCRICSLALKRNILSERQRRPEPLSSKLCEPGLVEVGLGQIYDRLFDNRQKGDYADLIRFDPDEVSDWYDEAREFVETLGDIVNRELEKD